MFYMDENFRNRESELKMNCFEENNLDTMVSILEITLATKTLDLF